MIGSERRSRTTGPSSIVSSKRRGRTSEKESPFEMHPKRLQTSAHGVLRRVRHSFAPRIRHQLYSGDLSGMAIDLESLHVSPTVPRELSIEAVEDDETLDRWVRSWASAYEMPEAVLPVLLPLFRKVGFESGSTFRFYLGEWKGNAVATSTLFFGGGVAGVYITVAPAYRHQGIG